MAEYNLRLLEALRVIQEVGREDLIKPGVMELAWAGPVRPKRETAAGVAAAVWACSPLQPDIEESLALTFKHADAGVFQGGQSVLASAV